MFDFDFLLRTLSLKHPISLVLQNGAMASIKPQQITFIVPGIKDFDHMEIPDFIQKAQDNLVCYI